jgi:2,4-dienoyl-CoA reductase-like NADH-dependent reductase (Old Yellow Enzyme family)
MAHGNILSQLLQFDLEGHSDEMRLALPVNIVKEIKKACGKEFTVISKMNANIGGIDRLVHYVSELHKAGMDAVELSGTDWTQWKRGDSLYYLPEARAVKERVGLPVILVGGMNSTETLQEALNEGVDLVSMCRAFIREPDFARKLKAGKADSKCVRCNQCLSIGKTRYKRCAFGSEIEFLKNTFQTE